MWKFLLFIFMVFAFAHGCAMTGTVIEYKPPALGEKAPDFWMKNQDQLRVSLSDFSGKKNVILVFFPLAFTPV